MSRSVETKLLARTLFFAPSGMYLLYLDESGSAGNTGDTHFILGGAAFFERQTHWLDVKLDDLAKSLRPSAPDTLEFHGSPMLAGRNWWRNLPSPQRRQAIRDALDAAHYLRGPWTLFGVVIEKAALRRENVVEYAFEQVVNRFYQFLSRRNLSALSAASFFWTVRRANGDYRSWPTNSRPTDRELPGKLPHSKPRG